MNADRKHLVGFSQSELGKYEFVHIQRKLGVLLASPVGVSIMCTERLRILLFFVLFVLYLHNHDHTFYTYTNK